MSIAIKKKLSAEGLINIAYQQFKKISDPRTFSTQKFIPIVDHLMCGLAIFSLKFPSLLQYDRHRKGKPIAENLKNLYHVDTPPLGHIS